MKKLIVLGLSIILLAGCTAKTETSNIPSILNKTTTSVETVKPATPVSAPAVSKPAVTISASTSNNSPAGWPKSLELKVPFAPQAPFGNWDAVHEETCEEASMIMASEYVKAQVLGDQAVEDELQRLLKWEADKGYKVDLTVAEAVKVLVQYFGVVGKVTTNVTTERIKSELVKGNILIIPVAGRLLNNPNFKAPGPIYHMLVVKGYDATNFITNDPGTRKGNGYKYSYQTIINAIHDWDHQLAEGGMTDTEMAQGAKTMIIIERP
jgi:hypothetical protein